MFAFRVGVAMRVGLAVVLLTAGSACSSAHSRAGGAISSGGTASASPGTTKRAVPETRTDARQQVTGKTPLPVARSSTAPRGTVSAPVTSASSVAGGTYHYDQVSDLEDQGKKTSGARGDYTIVVSPADGSRRQFSYQMSGGPPQAESSQWSATAETVLRIGGQVSGCSYSPPLLVLQMPLAQGAHWSSDSRCTGSNYAGRRVQTSSVGASKRVPSGRFGVVETWTIHTQGSISVQGVPGLTRIDFEDDVQYAPSLLVPIVETWVQKEFDGANEEHSQRRVRSLRST